jgi:cell division protein FtsQ
MNAGARSERRRTERPAGRRVRPNVSRRAAAARRRALLLRLVLGLEILAGAAGVAFAGVFFIFVHDMVMQSEHFNARTIQVEGGRRLAAGEILARAGIREGVNVLSVNLSAARNRLLAHPWIAAAEVRREIPATLRVRIREHVPAAVVDLGTRFLLNDQGEIFKQWEASDPAGLPVVSGLDPADLRVADRSGQAREFPLGLLAAEPAPAPLRTRPMDAVSQVLHLGGESNSAVPTRQLQAIRVDRELGLTLVAFDAAKAIRLGYDDYVFKYRLLADLMAFFKNQTAVADFDRIDLNDINRVIVNPAKAVPRLAGR